MSSYPEDDEDFEPTGRPRRGGRLRRPGLRRRDAETETEGPGRGRRRSRVELQNYDSEDAVAVVDEGDRAHAGLTPMGTKRGVTMSEEIDYRPPPRKLLERGKGDKGPIPETRKRSAASWSRRSATSGSRRRSSASSAARTSPASSCAWRRDQSQESDRAGQRPRLRAGLDRHPHPGADSRQAGGRRRGAQPDPPDGPPRRHLRRPAGEDLAAGRLARQGDRRQCGLDRHREDAARARRRHHRLGQERLRQRDPLLDPDAGLAERGPPGAGRPEAGRAQPLRERPAPADAGGHLATPRRQRPLQPDRRDGEPLRDHERGPRAATSTS